MSVTFNALPHDVLTLITSKLDSVSFGSFAQVNKNTNKAVSEFAQSFLESNVYFQASDKEQLLEVPASNEKSSFIQKFQLMQQRTFKISRGLIDEINKLLEDIDSGIISHLNITESTKEILTMHKTNLLELLRFEKNPVSFLEKALSTDLYILKAFTNCIRCVIQCETSNTNAQSVLAQARASNTNAQSILTQAQTFNTNGQAALAQSQALNTSALSALAQAQLARNNISNDIRNSMIKSFLIICVIFILIGLIHAFFL